MHGYTKVLFVVYIRTSHLKKHSYNSFEEFKIMSKSTLMKKFIDEQNVFRRKLWLENKLIMKNKELFLILNMSFKLILKQMYWKEEKRKNNFG